MINHKVTGQLADMATRTLPTCGLASLWSAQFAD